MKLIKFPRLNIKAAISLFIFILFVFIINTLGICQMQKLNMSGNSQEKTELNEDSSVKVVPYTAGSSESVLIVTDTSGIKLDQIVRGLKEAGYSLDEIAIILKNDNNNCSAISIACLKQGFTGDKIYKSLINAGFSKNSAQSAVPLSIRQEEQFFGIATNINETMSLGVLENSQVTSAEVDNKGQNTKAVVGIPSDVLEVPVSVGVTFNGLSNWNVFQDDRFNTERQ